MAQTCKQTELKTTIRGHVNMKGLSRKIIAEASVERDRKGRCVLDTYDNVPQFKQ